MGSEWARLIAASSLSAKCPMLFGDVTLCGFYYYFSDYIFQVNGGEGAMCSLLVSGRGGGIFLFCVDMVSASIYFALLLINRRIALGLGPPGRFMEFITLIGFDG